MNTKWTKLDKKLKWDKMNTKWTKMDLIRQ